MTIIALSDPKSELECKEKFARIPLTKKMRCAECGHWMHKGKTSKPEGEARCMDCKLVHGSTGMYKRGCRCEECKSSEAKRHRDYTEKFRAVHGVGPKTAQRKRVKELNGFWPQRGSKDWIEPLVRLSLYERDSWSCHLCGEAVNRDAHFNDDDAPSLDHLLPRSQGGTHEHTNLKTAHRLCNSTRRDAPLMP